MGHNNVVSSYSISTVFPRIDDWSKDPRVLGRHREYHFDVFLKIVFVI